MRHKLFTYTLLCAIPLAVLHVTALHFSLYWIFPWLDRVTHFLGGLTVALLCAALLAPFLSKKYIPALLLILVLIVGVGWEIFEYMVGIALYEPGYFRGTYEDLIFDVLGGCIGVYFSSRILENYGTSRS